MNEHEQDTPRDRLLSAIAHLEERQGDHLTERERALLAETKAMADEAAALDAAMKRLRQEGFVR